MWGGTVLRVVFLYTNCWWLSSSNAYTPYEQRLLEFEDMEVLVRMHRYWPEDPTVRRYALRHAHTHVVCMYLYQCHHINAITG